MIRYYSIMRPVAPGTYPEQNVVNIVNFDERQYIDEIDHMAYGYIAYKEPLEEKVAKQYELVREMDIPKEVKVAGSNGTAFTINNEYERFISEYCGECETEVFMRWNVLEDGFRAYCPHCGAVLMLCDECQHRDPNKDYCDPDFSDDHDCDFNHDGDHQCMMSKLA